MGDARRVTDVGEDLGEAGFTAGSCAGGLCADTGTLRCIESADGSEFACRCKPGWAGGRCEVDVDECASHPCLHGGLCEDSHTEPYIKPGSYHCSCIEAPDGGRYAGRHW